MSIEKVEDLIEHWKDVPSIGDCIRASVGAKPRAAKAEKAGPILISDEELRQLVTIEKAFAASHGKAAKA